MQASPEQLYELVWWTRRLFQQLRAKGDEILEGTDINASQRAVLEFLHQQQPQTVSTMAREHSVSRQHIQTVVNYLMDLSLVESQENPAHKRSPLISLTPEGKKLFSKISRKEARLLETMCSEFQSKNMETSIHTLKAVYRQLQAKSSK